MNKNIIKAAAVALSIIALNIITSCSDSESINDYTYENAGHTIHVTEDKQQNIRTYETLSENGSCVVWTYDDVEGTIALSIYYEDELIYNKSILNPEIYPEKYDSGDLKSTSNLDSLHGGRDYWFYYSYDYSQAGDDITWILSGPKEAEIPMVKLKANNAIAEYYAVMYMEAVKDMQIAELKAEACLSFEALNTIKYAVLPSAVQAAKGDTLLIISALDSMRDIDPQEIFIAREVYSKADRADMYYIFANDLIEDRVIEALD
ncbi:MAG: hypothetical protein HFE63_06780 [Clostridiales bacterium]|nr:hypothetical protein [Clostridiales bacterium]